MNVGTDLSIRSVGNDSVTLLENFQWKGQTNRDGKIEHLVSQGSAPVNLQTRYEDGVTILETDPVTLDNGLEWSLRLRLGVDAIEYEYRFQFHKPIPKSWFYISAAVPQNEGWRLDTLTDDRQAVTYQTPQGELVFTYDDSTDSRLSPHRPMLDDGFRLYVGQGPGGSPQRNFTTGEQFVIRGSITPPPGPGTQLESQTLANQVQMGLAQTQDDPHWLYTPGQTIRATVPVKIVPADEPIVQQQWRLTDYFGRTVWESSERVDLRKIVGEISIEIPAPEQFGPYRLTLLFSRILPSGQTEQVRKDVAVLGVRDPQWAEPRITAEQSHLGAIIHGGRSIHELARQLGFRWKRLMFETMWNWNSPAEGVYNFDPAEVRWQNSIGIKGLGNLVYSPGWAVQATDAERERVAKQRRRVHDLFSNRPPDLDAWRQYVREVATAFKDEIQYWELWNEPNVPLFWKGTPEQYVELLRITDEVLAEVDPDAKILGPAQAGGPVVSPWAQAVIDAGGLQYIDIWSTHQYTGETVFDADEAHAQIQRLKATLAEHDRPDMPVWWTEGGMGATTSMFRDAEFENWPDPAERAPLDPRKGYSLPKLFTVQKAENIKRYFFYFFKSHNKYSSYLSSEITGAPRFSMYPIAAWGKLIDGSIFAERLTQDELGFAYLFNREDGAVAILWADLADGQTAPLPLAEHEGVQAYDFLGNRMTLGDQVEIGLAPVYLFWPKHSATALRQAIQWDALPKLSNPSLIAERNRGAELNLPNISDFPIVNELGRDRLEPLDLRPYTNMGFADPHMGDGKGGWTDEGPMNDLHGVEPGLHTFRGVPIELIDPTTNNGTSVISLKSAKFPEGLENVTVPMGNRKLRGVFVMHAVQNYPKAGVVYHLIFHYADGQTAEVPMRYPEQVGSAWNPPNVIQEEAHHTKTVYLPVSAERRTMREDTRKWVEQTGSSIVYRYPRITYVENPKPDAGPIQSLEFRSTNPAGGVPVILGVTVPK